MAAERTAVVTLAQRMMRDNVSGALAGRSGCVMEHEGTICTGACIGAAYDPARQLEWWCDVWMRASAVGTPALLPDDEIERVVERFGGYGQSRP